MTLSLRKQKLSFSQNFFQKASRVKHLFPKISIILQIVRRHHKIDIHLDNTNLIKTPQFLQIHLSRWWWALLEAHLYSIQALQALKIE
jgi:hypothetical protein